MDENGEEESVQCSEDKDENDSSGSRRLALERGGWCMIQIFCSHLMENGNLKAFSHEVERLS